MGNAHKRAMLPVVGARSRHDSDWRHSETKPPFYIPSPRRQLNRFFFFLVDFQTKSVLIDVAFPSQPVPAFVYFGSDALLRGSMGRCVS